MIRDEEKEPASSGDETVARDLQRTAGERIDSAGTLGPALRPVTSRGPSAHPAAREHAAERSAPASRRVLVVDDNVDAAHILGLLVGLLGHEVRTANDGARALEIAGEFAPDVVVLDLGMPRMDGFEVARRMRLLAAAASAHLIAVTGYSQDQRGSEARAAGFDHLLTKPVDIEKLRALMNAGPARTGRGDPS